MNFTINPRGPVSRAFLRLGVEDFDRACDYIRNLPYGRTTDRANQLLVLDEGRGTCSGKHAILKKLAEENNADGIELRVGIYKMTGLNTPGVAKVIPPEIPYIPEAHVYLAFENRRLDFTRPGCRPLDEADILRETRMTADEVALRKERLHKNFVAEWCGRNGFRFADVWNIREACIAALCGGSG